MICEISLAGIGWIIAGVVLVIIIFIIIVVKASTKAKVAATWDARVKTLNANAQKFEADLRANDISCALTITSKAYFHTSTLHDIFRLCVDFDKKKIAVCSLEIAPYKLTILDFKDIKSFEILDGVQNSTSESYSSGGAVGGYGGAIGVSSTDTYTSVTMENVRLKIETFDPYKPGIVIPMFVYQVDTSSETYKILLQCIEDVKSILGKIVEGNNKSTK